MVQVSSFMTAFIFILLLFQQHCMVSSTLLAPRNTTITSNSTSNNGTSASNPTIPTNTSITTTSTTDSATSNNTFASIVPFDAPFSQNFLSAIFNNRTVSEAVALAPDSAGGFFVAGNIELIRSGADPSPSLPSPIADVPSDTPGRADMLIGRVLPNGTLAWARRTGTRGADWVNGIASDSAGHAYVLGYASGSFAGGETGATLMKFDGTGARLWVRSYGSRSDSLLSVSVISNSTSANVDSSVPQLSEELLITGSVSRSSPLIDSWPGGTENMQSLALVLRASPADGAMLAAAAAGALHSSSAAVGLRKGDTVFAAGSATVDDSGRLNAAVFAFDYPSLTVRRERLFISPRGEYFTALTASRNPYSLYAAGSTDVSLYEESDARIMRLNTSDLGRGWSVTEGSVRFSSAASVRAGEATEHARSAAVDHAGNLYILMQSTSRLRTLADKGVDDELTNMRPAVLVLDPSGEVVDALQAKVEVQASALAMLLQDDVVAVAGSVFDRESLTTQAFIMAARIAPGTRIRHADEFVPTSAIDPEQQGPNQPNVEVNTGTSIWVIVGSVIAGVVVTVLIITVVLCMARRENDLK